MCYLGVGRAFLLVCGKPAHLINIVKVYLIEVRSKLACGERLTKNRLFWPRIIMIKVLLFCHGFPSKGQRIHFARNKVYISVQRPFLSKYPTSASLTSTFNESFGTRKLGAGHQHHVRMAKKNYCCRAAVTAIKCIMV